MNRNSYIAVFVGLAVVILFFIVSGFNFPLGGSVALDGIDNSQDAAVSDVSALNNAGSGLMYQDVVEGVGEEAVAGKVLTVHYIGTLEDGTVFDSSVSREEPFVFTLGAGKVIAGWDQGLAGMKVGGQRLLVIPPELGYGQTENGPIPANSTLIFQVELLEVADQ